jgi:hypothetical protein
VTETSFDANGSMWRLRSLVAMGHSGRRLARALGMREDRVRRLLRGQTKIIDRRTFLNVYYLFEAWWDKRPPARTRTEKAAITIAYQTAARNRWPTPANLDEPELDREPGYRPKPGWKHGTGVGIADDYPLGLAVAEQKAS